MQILLIQLDGKIPNLALMRIAPHHRARGDRVIHRAAGNVRAIQPRLDEPRPDRVYASAIFERTRPLVREVLRTWPGAVLAGTGSDSRKTLSYAAVDGRVRLTTPEVEEIHWVARFSGTRVRPASVPRDPDALKALAEPWNGIIEAQARALDFLAEWNAFNGASTRGPETEDPDRAAPGWDPPTGRAGGRGGTGASTGSSTPPRRTSRSRSGQAAGRWWITPATAGGPLPGPAGGRGTVGRQRQDDDLPRADHPWEVLAGRGRGAGAPGPRPHALSVGRPSLPQVQALTRGAGGVGPKALIRGPAEQAALEGRWSAAGAA